MGQALYRKYRSKSLKEVIGQEHVTTTLSKALKSGAISHAYLFTGPRGVGKTSVARILAHEINNLTYDDDSANIDIIEIDAASNRRIDEIRELRDTVRVAPTSSKYKVYIIDEVHMLTKEAFNALLKTLEEPPAHVIFILATTDVNKLPETIISRTQRFHFHPADKADLHTVIKNVSDKESIAIDKDAIDLLASHSDGSYRDALSLLDQARSYGPRVTVETIENLLGLPPMQAMEDLFSSALSTNTAHMIELLETYYDQGIQAISIASDLSKKFRDALINNQKDIKKAETLTLLERLLDIPAAHDPERLLEIVLLEYAATNDTKIEIHQTIAQHHSNDKDMQENVPSTDEITAITYEQRTKDHVRETSDDSISDWDNVLLSLKKKHNTLYGIVRMAQAEFTDKDTLILTLSFAFHQKRLQESANQKILADTIASITGKDMTIEFKLDPSGKNKTVPTSTTIDTHTDETLSAISNIFSGAELLES